MNKDIPNQTTQWHVKIDPKDQSTFEMLLAVIKACKVPHFIFPTNISDCSHYALTWRGTKMADSVIKPPGIALTVQQAIQWLSAYVAPPPHVDIDSDMVIGHRLVRKLQVYKTGVKVLDLYGDKMGWIVAEDILACADAIKKLRKQ